MNLEDLGIVRIAQEPVYVMGANDCLDECDQCVPSAPSDCVQCDCSDQCDC